MAVNLSPVGGVAVQFFTNSGAVLTGGKIFTYAAGTTTPQATFTNASGSTSHSNPIILDASGRVPSGEIWLTDGFAYKFLLKDANDVLIGTYDNISGINSNFVNFTSQQEIQTATASQTVFTLTTMQYQPGTNSLTVYVDGVNQYGPGASYAYLETNSTTVTFISGLHVGAEVKFTSVQQATSSATSADQVSYLPAGTGAVATNVQDKLRQTVSVKDFGAVGDGVTDDTAAVQAAIDFCVGKRLYFPRGVYLCTATINVVRGIVIYGDGSLLTIVKFDIDAFTDGIVFGTGGGGTAPYEDVQVYNICFEGAIITEPTSDYVRDVVFINSLYKATFNAVQIHGGARNALRIYQSLHTEFYNCRIEDALEDAINITDGVNTTIVLDSCYIRKSGGAGVKTNCLGLTVRSCIFEGIGEIDRASTKTYAPGLYANGGTTFIHDMYCEDVTGHNIFADAGILYVNTGNNQSGAGADTALYAGLFVQGSAVVYLAGAAFTPGGGNKKGVKISSAMTGQVNGMLFTQQICTAASLSSPLQYTNCTYNVANFAALAALTPTTGQTAHTQNSGFEYIYSGSAWVIVNPNQFFGRLYARDSALGIFRTYGKNTTITAGDSDSEIVQFFVEVFNAAVGADNVAALQSGAVIPANSQVAANKTFIPNITGFASGSAQDYLASFNVAFLPSGLGVRANILNAGVVQVVVFNFTTSNITLSNDIKGRVLVTRYRDIT